MAAIGDALEPHKKLFIYHLVLKFRGVVDTYIISLLQKELGPELQ